MSNTNTNPSSSSHDNYRIALYYCYVSIEDVDECISLQQDLCASLNLCGRIRVSPEGMNGVLSGLYQDLLQYHTKTSQQLNVDLDVKYCRLRLDLTVQSQLFPSLSIKATRQVVSLYEPQQDAQEMLVEGVTRRKHGKEQRQRHDSSNKEDSPKMKLLSLTRAPPQHCTPAPHVSPQEWNKLLLQACPKDTILVDARNVYESRVGHFAVEGIPTLLTNTRKYSYLPQVLQVSQSSLHNKRVFMYCTGGVRCEQASAYLQGMKHGPKEIYQLQGGIQRYLEAYGSHTDGHEKNEECLYQGKNFVFDLRRTDPCVGVSSIGQCVVCQAPHDDYDNGHAPSEHQEARCCQCRVLVLVCNECRSKVRLWGEQGKGDLPALYCGGMSCVNDGNCIQAVIV